MIVLCKLKKSDYIDSKTYQFIALLDIMSKALKCYKYIKIDKTEQDWSFNQFAMHASEYSA